MRFATCPPPLWGSSLTSAKRTTNPLFGNGRTFRNTCEHKLPSSNGCGVFAEAKSRRSPNGAGDMSVGRYDVAVAGYRTHTLQSNKQDTDRKLKHVQKNPNR